MTDDVINFCDFNDFGYVKTSIVGSFANCITKYDYIIRLPWEQPVKTKKEASRYKFQIKFLKKRASKKPEFTQVIKYSLKAIWPTNKRLMFWSSFL